MIGEVTNHLWQSTLFAAMAGITTIALRHNGAQVRYALWFAASIKFLLPFSLLINLGNSLAPAAKQIAAPSVTVAIERIARPFPPPNAPTIAETDDSTNWKPVALLVIWTAGLLAIIRTRVHDWLRIRAAVRASAESPLAANVRSSPGLLEPGVVGWLRPIILLPAGIEQHLTPTQVDVVLAHEICHIRRHDNLTSAIHMVVEAVFWFHPLVWWIGARLMEERERACDEAVVRASNQPGAYAAAILNVCKLYAESPLQCVAGVTGRNALKKRIEAIMINRTPLKLSAARKLLLTTLGLSAAFGPLTVGLLKGQPSSEPRLAFDVASVKQHVLKEGFARRGWTSNIQCPGMGQCGLTGTRFTELMASLTDLIMDAYKVRRHQIAGLPSWGDTGKDVYDIFATADSPPTLDQARRMLQTLLAERFQLKVHRETRIMPVYALTLAKNGPKLIRDTKEENDPKIAFHRSWERVAEVLSMSLDRPVIDKTGLEGTYSTHAGDDPIMALDFGEQLQFRGAPPRAAGPGGGSIFTQLQEKWGMKLEPQKGPVDVIVIDHVERPSGN